MMIDAIRSFLCHTHTHRQKVVVVVAESFHKFTQKTLQLGDLSECDVVGIWLNPNVYIVYVGLFLVVDTTT